MVYDNLQLEIEDPHENHFQVNGASSLNICIIIIIINLNYAVRKITAIIIQSTYYIFCMRNKPWTNPDLLT